ncbi:MAG: class I SAM-dependent methyltransferase [bacterium]
MKSVLLKSLAVIGLYPNILIAANPFKIYEFKELLKGVVFSPQDTVLDIGCGVGLQTLLLGKRCHRVIGTDVSDQVLAQAARKAGYLGKSNNCQFVNLNLENSSLPAESLDKAFSICVLEHIPNYKSVLQQVHRSLKKGGQLILSVDALSTIKDAELVAKHRREYQVVKYFNASELTHLLEETGFRDVQVYPIFCSNFARDLFSRGIRNGFRYGILEALISYLFLRHHEANGAPEDQGIFLVAKCRKN